MNETTHVNEEREAGVDSPRPARLRTCVGCGEHIDVVASEDAVIRLILGPDGAIAIDPKGGGFGRGAHVHARRTCVERAAKSGLLRATKGRAHLISEAGEAEKPDANAAQVGPSTVLSADSLARAIQRSMDRRVEGLITAAVRSRQVAAGSDAVTGACHRGEAELVVVACDAAAAADLTEVRRAVAEGRAVAWGTKQALGALLHPGKRAQGAIAHTRVQARLEAPEAPAGSVSAGIGVLAIASRNLASAIRRAVQSRSAIAEGATSTASNRAAPRRDTGRAAEGAVRQAPKTPAPKRARPGPVKGSRRGRAERSDD
jgi:predicted RNA-binding protein YlxR (DUF448 family)/ribosomal protein L7Ae-like RNA K-turn-binding protein